MSADLLFKTMTAIENLFAAPDAQAEQEAEEQLLTVRYEIHKHLVNITLDQMAANAKELGLTYDASVAQIDTSAERVEKEAENVHEQPAPAQEPQPPYEFERYVAGSLRAQGVRVERATTLADAMRIAARICPPANPPSAPTVLIYTTPPAPAQPLTDEQIEEIAARTLFPVNFARAIEAAHGITKGGA